MPDPNAKLRAAARLVEVLTPAAALGIACPDAKYFCQARHAGTPCHNSRGEVKPMCFSRLEAAGAKLHQIVLTLFDLC
jgi:hypothetical protein